MPLFRNATTHLNKKLPGNGVSWEDYLGNTSCDEDAAPGLRLDDDMTLEQQEAFLDSFHAT